MDNKTATHIGYYLHKDGTPTAAPISELEAIKKDYKYYKLLSSDEEVKAFLNTYNAGYSSNRINIKPFTFRD